ncbi:MAG: ATP-dependent acyl-CoA ligase [Chloroflexi bacterium]|nr:MAG: ATP-dependent acyl-CoA ligase [Chloroflexota bacterium]
MPRTIPALFDGAVHAAGDRTWLHHEDRAYTFGAAAARIAGAAWVLRDHGVVRGSVVMATTRNTDAYLFTWLAAVRLGALLVTVDPRSSAAELAGLAGQTRPHLVVTDAEAWAAVEQAVAGTPPPARLLSVDDVAGESVSAAAPPPAEVREEDPAVLIPTSGTTGRSKLVTQTHRAYAMAGEGFPYWMRLTGDDRLMTSLPLFHINAPAYSMLGSVAARAGLVLLPRFSAGGFLDAARRYAATEFNAIGAMLEMLMRQPERPDDAGTPLRLCYTGPAPPRERHLEIERRLGIEIVCGYALSESPYGLCWRHGTRPFESLGSPRQHPELGEVNRARVMEDGRPVAAGEVGELELSNPCLMLGYHGMPEETAAVLVDGWLRTGDLVREDRDGTYSFVGRRKEVIRRRGENLAPGEVEAALEAHPDVAEAAVVGVPSELSEEEVKAFVMLRAGASTSPAELHAFARTRLIAFKLPRYIELVDELPHTPTGRIAKHRLPLLRTQAEWDAEES